MTKSVIRDIHQVIPLLPLSFIPQPRFQSLNTLFQPLNTIMGKLMKLFY
jgi:hypothetical protein